VQSWGKRAGCAKRARDGQPERFYEQIQGREVERSGALYQLARNRYRYPGVPFRLKLDPCSRAALVGILNLGFVERG
jgi:hypothetical protein